MLDEANGTPARFFGLLVSGRTRLEHLKFKLPTPGDCANVWRHNRLKVIPSRDMNIFDRWKSRCHSVAMPTYFRAK
jgi:hypothetical protein